MALGVPEAAIRTVSLGEEGALCLDNSDVCRRMNRRAHLELRKIGLEHMVLAPLATEAMTDSLNENLERSTEPGLAESISDISSAPSSDADHTAATPNRAPAVMSCRSAPGKGPCLSQALRSPLHDHHSRPYEVHMLARRSAAHRHRSGRLAARLILCALLSLEAWGPPSPAESAEPPATLSTGVIPTMGLNDATEGALLFRTGQPGRYLPGPYSAHRRANSHHGDHLPHDRHAGSSPTRARKEDWLEGVYVFPLPETAAVDQLRMKVGERIIEGQIKERAEAKRRYEQAKQEGKRTSLVEQERSNLFTTSVANIGPGERITVEIEYQETVRYENGQFLLRFPMAVGQRYIPARR